MRIDRTRTSELSPVLLAEAKAHLRVMHDDENDEIIGHIAAASLEVEDAAAVALLTQTVTVSLDGWPAHGFLHLPIGPVLSDAIIATTTDGEAFTEYTVQPGRRARLTLTTDLTHDLREALVEVNYTAGFGPDPEDIPQDLRSAIMDQAARYYENRGTAEDKLGALSPFAARAIGRYRRVAL